MSALLQRVAEFLFHEAQLLDERRFEDWLALFEPDGWYWVPVDPQQTKRKHALAIIDDSHPELEFRIQRLLQPTAHTERPPPSACRVISNISIEDPLEVSVRSKLVMHEFRRREFASDDYRLLCGTVRHGLRPEQDTFRIRWKRVDLIDAQGASRLMPTPI